MIGLVRRDSHEEGRSWKARTNGSWLRELGKLVLQGQVW